MQGHNQWFWDATRIKRYPSAVYFRVQPFDYFFCQLQKTLFVQCFCDCFCIRVWTSSASTMVWNLRDTFLFPLPFKKRKCSVRPCRLCCQRNIVQLVLFSTKFNWKHKRAAEISTASCWRCSSVKLLTASDGLMDSSKVLRYVGKAALLSVGDPDHSRGQCIPTAAVERQSHTEKSFSVHSR